jgi:NAD(P)-dependent dehydrogenase (short-subunit alcohol dehydrogenase family)
VIVEGKTIVVTGVGPGLGREVAGCALRDGANVVIGARTAEKLEKISGELDPSGERIAHVPTDITDAESCQALMQTAADRFGGIDAIVQVAALDTLFGSLQSTSVEDWQASMNTNVIGTLQLVKAAVEPLKKRGGGSIVLIGSQSMWDPPPMPQIAYASAKGALVSAMLHITQELGPEGIRINMVIPTWMWGPPVQGYVKWQSQERGIGEDEIVGEITAKMPLGEIPADEDVAEACIFFCSDRARMITGQTLLVNAGELLR